MHYFFFYSIISSVIGSFALFFSYSIISSVIGSFALFFFYFIPCSLSNLLCYFHIHIPYIYTSTLHHIFFISSFLSSPSITVYTKYITSLLPSFINLTLNPVPPCFNAYPKYGNSDSISSNVKSLATFYM